MAFKYQLILPTAILLTVLATASASVEEQYVPGREITYDSLQSCHDYVVRQTCGVGPYYVPVETKRRCCEQLLVVSALYRCEALRILTDGRVGVIVSLLEYIPGCKTLSRKYIAGVTGGGCNLKTVSGRL